MNPTIHQFWRLAVRKPVLAAIIAFWYATRRRVRARGQLADACAQLPFAYRHWVQQCADDDIAVLTAADWAATTRTNLTVHFHVVASHDDSLLTAVSSLLRQSWPHWNLIVTTSSKEAPRVAELLPDDERISLSQQDCDSRFAGITSALAAARTTYLVPLPQDCYLPSNALLAYAAHIATLAAQELPVIYADQIETSGSDRNPIPWLKPDWDFDMFLAQDYLSDSCALPVTAALASGCDHVPGDCAAVYSMLLNLAKLPQLRFVHLHRIAAATPPAYWKRSCPERLAVLQQLFDTTNGTKTVRGPFGSTVVNWPLPAKLPLVTIIIPTRDRVDLLQPCVEGVLEQTKYPNFEIIIADNGSVEPATKVFLDGLAEDRRVRVVSWPYAYNYSSINNFAVQDAQGEFLCLLNNDIEIIDGEWLSEMMRHACRDGVGAVGARLLYADGSIQHAGVAIGIGNAAGHAHRGLPKNEPGYFAHSLIARGATAVTAACLVVSRKWFDAVGGLDEKCLGIAYNDVDFCLKLRRAGARNMYVPTAVLVHHESKSRGLDMAPEHLERYMAELSILQERWDTTTFCDPSHHPELDRSSEIYKVAYKRRGARL